MLVAIGTQARHPQFTRLATPGDPTFDIVISYWRKNPDDEIKGKVGLIITNFAHCVYESTEGVHRLKKVRIFTSEKNADKCDIQWIQYRHADSSVRACGSIGANGYIAFGDSMNYPVGLYNYLNWEPERGGYVLGHEWGHYAYSLYDEYKDAGGKTLNEKLMPYPSLMAGGGHDAKGGKYEHLKFSVRHRGGNAIDGFGPYENTKATWHHAVYGESCWETLGRGEPSFWAWGDLFRWPGSLRPRTSYPELAAVARLLEDGGIPTILLDKPGQKEYACEALKIIWMEEPAVQIVLDRSGSMGGTPLANVKAAAQNLIDTIEDGASVGVIAFDDTVSVVAPIVKITGSAVRANLKAAVAGITVGNTTAIGDAMLAALSGLQSYGINDRTAAVFLLTDGDSNAGVDPQSVVPAYRAANVSLFGFGYGSGVDSRLEGFALDTGGKYYAAPVSYNAVKFAFLEGNAAFSGRFVVLNGNTDPAFMGVMSTAEPVHIPFLVDSSMEDFRLSIVYSGSGTPSVSLGLMAPDSTLLTVAPTNAPDGSVLMDFRVDNPMAGEWAIVGERPPGTHISYLADAKAAGGYCLDWVAFEQPDFSLEYLTVVSLRGEGSIDGAQVTGEIRFDNGETVSCVFSNFATGLYGVMNAVTHTGRGKMIVTASNPNGTAVMTWRDAQIAADENGNSEPPEDEPVTENFMRVISERIFVKSYLYVDAGRPDDSGDGLTWESAFKNLQPAIDIAWDSVTIGVTNGTYAPIVTGNKPITIQSVNGADVTVIDGGGTNRCATLGSWYGHVNTVLTGFTLTNGWASNGGGSSYGTLNDCVLSGNTATDRGGGAHFGTLNNCTLMWNMAEDGGGAYYGTLVNCVVTDNTANYGGGGVCFGTLNNCILARNSAAWGGGGIGGMYDILTMDNCILTGNSAIGGGGIYSAGLNNGLLLRNTATDYGGGACNGLLRNCTVIENTAVSYGGGVYDGELFNCIVWGNLVKGVTNNHGWAYLRYSCSTPLPTSSYNGAGNITQDPLFVDATEGDFRLQDDSPCINAGTNYYVVGTIDLDGKPRIREGRVDMGAYEYDKLRPAQGVPVPIPLDWLDLYLGWQDVWGYADLALSQGANGYLFWESYVAGLSPTRPDSKFLITNFVVKNDNGKDTVTALDWGPRRADRVYKVWGKTNLTDGAWHSPTNDATRFFKVDVKMQ